MNELQFGDTIRQALNRRSAQLSPDVAEQLRIAREQALSHQRPEQPERATVLAGAGTNRSWGRFSLRWLLPAAALLIGLSAIYSWQQKFRVAEVAEVDARLLTDELPIDAYLDKGFQAWLKKRAAER
ncbi:MAG: DUF3619 family protein [Burkholderiales bacterium]